jgi:CubicO group peptidase (beta-lactamase class C family)
VLVDALNLFACMGASNLPTPRLARHDGNEFMKFAINRYSLSGMCRRLLASTIAAMALACACAPVVVAGATTLPDTPAGKLAGEIIGHVNKDTPEQIRIWAASIVSPQFDADGKAVFVGNLVSATRDGGGVDVIDARTDPGQPGLLEVAVKARRTGQRALFVLAADAKQPGKLVQADVVTMEDPAIHAGWPKGSVSHGEMARLLHSTMDRLVAAADFSGCLTVVDGATTVFDECRGRADRRFGVPIDRQTIFHIGSIDKMFTAVAIAQLVQAGKLSWNDTLAQRVPEYPDHAAAHKITVWQLLHHTAGLGDFLVPEYFRQREKFVDARDYLDLIAHQPRVGIPGKDWNYSNAGYVLLGRIIENVSHENYFEYIQRHVFDPAGMTSSGFDALDDVTPQLAVGYFHPGLFSTEWKADWMKIPYKGGPAGGGYSNNVDLLRFAQALRAGKLVDSATMTKMFDDEVPAGPGGYAAGFGDRLSHGLHIRGHAGGIEGTDANLQMVWETGAAVALTSNEGPGQTWLLAERIADLLAAAGARH